MVEILLDTFQGVNGTALSGHTPEMGGPWVDDTAGFQIQGNSCQQAVDNAESHVAFSQLTVRALATLELNGMDAANSFYLRLQDTLNNNSITFQAVGDRSWNLFQRAAGAGTFTANGSGGRLLLPASGPFKIVLEFGPSVCALRVNGEVWASLPRGIALPTKLTQLHIIGGALNAKPSPILSRVQLTNG